MYFCNTHLIHKHIPSNMRIFYFFTFSRVCIYTHIYLGDGLLFKISKVKKQGKWSEIPLRSIAANILFLASGIKDYGIGWQYEWGTGSWGKHQLCISYRRNHHMMVFLSLAALFVYHLICYRCFKLQSINYSVVLSTTNKRYKTHDRVLCY